MWVAISPEVSGYIFGGILIVSWLARGLRVRTAAHNSRAEKLLADSPSGVGGCCIPNYCDWAVSVPNHRLRYAAQ
jgi:hypothetical protein